MLLIGLAAAVENIDEIIKIIKNSKDTTSAKKNLLLKKWKIKKSIKIINLLKKRKISLATNYQKVKLMQF